MLNVKKGFFMFNNTASGRRNLCGKIIYDLRKKQGRGFSQRKLADKLQVQGVDLDKNAVQRIESGQRFVTDIELVALSKVFHVSVDYLLGLADWPCLSSIKCCRGDALHAVIAGLTRNLSTLPCQVFFIRLTVICQCFILQADWPCQVFFIRLTVVF